MGYFTPSYPSDRQTCVFEGLCNHAPATEVFHHEFSNSPSKPMCADHAERVRNWLMSPKKKEKK
jgi:hypothetical protein